MSYEINAKQHIKTPYAENKDPWYYINVFEQAKNAQKLAMIPDSPFNAAKLDSTYYEKGENSVL